MEGSVNNYKGLNQDIGYDLIQDAYIDAQNIRISTVKGKSGGSWTNIKGHTVFFVLPDNDALIRDGYKEIIGYTTIRNIIILFVADDSGTNGWVYKILYDDSLNYVSTTLLYADAALNFSKENPIKAVGRYENEITQRVYWTDYSDNFFRSINIADPNLITTDVGLIDIYPNVIWTQPIISGINPGGSLEGGVYQIAYKLTTSDGKETLISPPSVPVHITSSSEGQTSEKYIGFLGPTQKSILVTIDTTNYQEFKTISIYALRQTTYNGTPEIYEVEIQDITGNSMEFLITGAEFSSLVNVDTFTIKNFAFKTAKTLVEKDGSLILSNIKSQPYSIQNLLQQGETFDAKVYRYLNDGVTACATAFNEEYNKDAHWSADWHDNEQFKYKSDGFTLGGEGANISFTFHLEKITLDSQNSAGDTFVNPTNTGAPDLEDTYTYENTSYPSLASPQLSGVIRGYKRGETYRFGIIGYNKKGEASFVEFIGDIKFPDIGDGDNLINASGTDYFPLSTESGSTTYGYCLGIEFTIDLSTCLSLLDSLESYQIVRVKRTNTDKRRFCSGVINTFALYPIGTAGPEYDFSDPVGGGDILHLNWDVSNAGHFGYLQNQVNSFYTNIPAAVHAGEYFAFLSPELSYNFNNSRDFFAASQNAYMLITGAYLNYDLTPADPRYIFNIELDFDTAGAEDLGKVSDIRRKIPTTVGIEVNSKAPYDGITNSIESRRVEYIRKIKNKEFIDFKNELSDPNFDFDNSVAGPFVGTGGDAFYMRNYAVRLDDTPGNALNVPNNLTSTTLSKGAFAFLGNLELINNDPLIPSPLTIYSNENCFKGGALDGSSEGYVVPAVGNYDDARPIVEILLAKSEIYGGFTQNALENNVFIPCSPVVPISDLNIKVFGGDTFLNMWSMQESTIWTDRRFFNQSAAVANQWQRGWSKMTHLVVESSINIELDYGSNAKREVAYSVNGGSSGIEKQVYRQETNNSYNLYGNSKDMYKYYDVFSKESDTLSFFVDARQDTTAAEVNDIRNILSNVKTNGELVDSWTKFGILNFWDVDDFGPINEILTFRNYVYFFQDRAFGYLSVNPRALASTSDGVQTELGTAQGIVDHVYLSQTNGAIHQWAIKSTAFNIYFFDGIHRKIFSFSEGLNPLSEIKGMHSFLNNLPASISKRKENDGDNPILFSGVHIGRDLINDEVLFTFLTSGDAVPLAITTLYTIGTLVSYLYQGETLVRLITIEYTSGDLNYSALITQLLSKSSEYFADFTLVLDELEQEFSSFYTAKPQIYVENSNLLLSPPPGQSPLGVSGLFKHNNGNYGTFYGNVKESYIQLIVNPKSEVNKVLRFLEFTSIVKTDAQVISRLESITAFRIHNEYQDTGKVTVSSSNLKRKFDKWRLKIPRDINSTNQKGRLRSSYFIVTLYYDNSTNKELIMNRLLSYYDIQIF